MEYTFEFIIEVLKLKKEDTKTLKDFIVELSDNSYNWRKDNSNLEFCNAVTNYIKYKTKIKKNKPYRQIIHKYENLLKLLKEETLKYIVNESTFPNTRGFNSLLNLLTMLLQCNKEKTLKIVEYIKSLGFDCMNYVAENEITYNIDDICGFSSKYSVTEVFTDGVKRYKTKKGEEVKGEQQINQRKYYYIEVTNYHYVIRYYKINEKLQLSIDINSLDFETSLDNVTIEQNISSVAEKLEFIKNKLDIAIKNIEFINKGKTKNILKDIYYLYIELYNLCITEDINLKDKIEKSIKFSL